MKAAISLVVAAMAIHCAVARRHPGWPAHVRGCEQHCPEGRFQPYKTDSEGKCDQSPKHDNIVRYEDICAVNKDDGTVTPGEGGVQVCYKCKFAERELKGPVNVECGEFEPPKEENNKEGPSTIKDMLSYLEGNSDTDKDRGNPNSKEERSAKKENNKEGPSTIKDMLSYFEVNSDIDREKGSPNRKEERSAKKENNKEGPSTIKDMLSYLEGNSDTDKNKVSPNRKEERSAKKLELSTNEDESLEDEDESLEDEDESLEDKDESPEDEDESTDNPRAKRISAANELLEKLGLLRLDATVGDILEQVAKMNRISSRLTRLLSQIRFQQTKQLRRKPASKNQRYDIGKRPGKPAAPKLVPMCSA